MLADTLSMFRGKLRQLYSNLTAAPCLLCGAISKQSCLCVQCINALPLLDSVCPRCATPTLNNALCGQCLHQPPAQNTSISLFAYHHPVDKLIADFKYHDKLFLARFFADCMAEKLKYRELPNLFIPIPLHPKRLRQRGYNQSLELAKALSSNLSVPVLHDGLIRIKDTLPQVSLPIKARRQNVQRVFKIGRATLPPYVALIDDVLTTGYTADAAAEALRKAGVNNISVWTIARAI